VRLAPVRLGPEVAAALREGRPVVALETSVVAQGLPPPRNLQAALACEEAVRVRGAVPATTAVIGGELRAGLEPEELERLADPGTTVRKLSSRDLGWALAAGALGATTVAGAIRIAALAGIRFMATGGIGGVHRLRPGHPEDQSGDLFELSRSPVAVFCAGAKMILDIPATLERLESLAVPVLGYQCDEFPAFYSAVSGRPVPARVDGPEAAARALAAAWATGAAGAVVATPPPEELLGSAGIVQQALDETASVEGPAATPAALARIAELTGGRSVEVNVELVVNNAAVAADCAVAWSRLGE
jgi:pseudouridine-5'-phosphate glycosidase